MPQWNFTLNKKVVCCFEDFKRKLGKKVFMTPIYGVKYMLKILFYFPVFQSPYEIMDLTVMN